MSRAAFVHTPDGTTWPTGVVEPEDDTLEWKLRYADHLTLSDRLVAAGYVSAYLALVQMPRTKREKVVAQIRKARAVAAKEGK